jgi:hypothetical protein
MAHERCDLVCIDAPRAEAIRETLLLEEAAQESADRARALSDPTRLTLAAAFARGRGVVLCATSPGSQGRSQNLVSHHLRTLRLPRHGSVPGGTGKMVMYSLTGRRAFAPLGRAWARVRRGRRGWRREPPEEDAAGPRAVVPGARGPGAGGGSRGARLLHGLTAARTVAAEESAATPTTREANPEAPPSRHHPRWPEEDRRARRGNGLRELRGDRREARRGPARRGQGNRELRRRVAWTPSTTPGSTSER